MDTQTPSQVDSEAAPAPKRPPIVDLSMFNAGMLESASKAVAAFVICSYAIGFLVILINEGHLGFIDASLLKPRAILAGATCVFLVALPLSYCRGTFFPRPETEARIQRAARVGLGLADYLGACWATWLVAGIFFVGGHFTALIRMHGTEQRPDKIAAAAFIFGMLSVTVNGWLRLNVGQIYREAPRGWLIFSCVVSAVLVGAPIVLWRTPSMRYLVWACITSAVFLAFERDWRRGISRTFKLPALIAILLSVLSLYGQFIFPHLKGTWGGGAPVEALLTLPSKSAGGVGDEISVRLYEATDSGYYVSLKNQKSVVFLPKLTVEAIEYPPETFAAPDDQ